jgi:hypothetical protein
MIARPVGGHRDAALSRLVTIGRPRIRIEEESSNGGPHVNGGALHRAASLLCLVLAAASAPAAAFEPDQHLSVYGGVYSPNRFIELIGIRQETLRADTSSGLVAVALARELGHTGESLRWELEVQLVQHWGVQRHQEVNVVLVARWLRFPWNHLVATSLAFGQGLSYATRVPPLEPRADPDEGESARLLNYLLMELELGPPNSPWRGFARVHHRSGAFGVYGGVRGGSNFVALGVRYQF